jgi:hypothetical protein
MKQTNALFRQDANNNGGTSSPAAVHFRYSQTITQTIPSCIMILPNPFMMQRVVLKMKM